MLAILLVFLTGPFLCGGLVNSVISHKRKDSYIFAYPIGLLTVFCIFMADVFLALKFDWNLLQLKDWFIRVLGATELVGLGVFAFDFFKNRMVAKKDGSCAKHKFDFSPLFFVVPAILLAVECFFLLEPSYVNTDTIEMAKTTLSGGELYKYAALSGREMIVGLPIWSKIQIMPLFYAVMAEASGMSPEIFTGIIVPLLLYVLNIAIMWLISGELIAQAGLRRRATFMCLYLCILYAGTYISDYGIVTTTGYALLREGYSGYAVCWALVFPLFFIYILKKKYWSAAFTLIPIIGLVRVDIYVNILLKDAQNAFGAVNESGKLAGIWLIALVILAIMALEKKATFRPVILLCPSAMIAYTVENLGYLIDGRKKRIVYYLGASCIIFAACAFLPCDDATPSADVAKLNDELSECIGIIKNEMGDEPIVLYSSREILENVRRTDSSVRILYGRNAYRPEMSAYDFEGISPYVTDYMYYSMDWIEAYDCYTLSCEIPQLIDEAVEEGVNAVILVDPVRPEITGGQFEDRGFAKVGSTGRYVIYTRN